MIGNTYDEFVKEFMQAAVNRFGKSILIHFEDFANKNAFSLLNKYREEYCVFNDDIQGTGACVLAGILASCKIRGVPLANNIILFFGAGEAALGISELLVKALIKENISEEEAIQKLWLIDSQGLIVHNRPEGKLEDLKLKYAKNHQPMKDLLSIIRSVKPSILIGASGIPRVFTKDILEEMALINKEPVIFALSNPTSKSECTAKEAFTFTKGNCLFASGSPFESVVENNVRYFPSQANNYLVFPGLALGIISVRISPILDEDFLLAANTLVSCLNECDLKQKLLFPPITKCKSYSLKIATKLAEQAYKDGRASLFPEPLNKKNFIENSRYDFSYK